ncbi:MAG: hypothetical protein RL199_322 [Pseudomonadota bacterium]|jgi:hypothetical protein
MNRRWLLLVLLLARVAHSVAHATDKAPPLLVVLEFDSPDQAVTDGELQTLTDALRGAVKKEVGTRFKVLTRETMVEIVPPERLRCFVGKCVADIGRMLQAPYTIAGNVRSFGSKKVLTVEGYESNGGQLLGAEQLRGANAEELLDGIEARARGFVREWLGLGTGALAQDSPGTQWPRPDAPSPSAAVEESLPPNAASDRVAAVDGAHTAGTSRTEPSNFEASHSSPAIEATSPQDAARERVTSVAGAPAAADLPSQQSLSDAPPPDAGAEAPLPPTVTSDGVEAVGSKPERQEKAAPVQVVRATPSMRSWWLWGGTTAGVVAAWMVYSLLTPSIPESTLIDATWSPGR